MAGQVVAQVSPARTASPRSTRRRGNFIILATILAVVVAVAYFGVAARRRSQPQASASAQQPASASQEAQAGLQVSPLATELTKLLADEARISKLEFSVGGKDGKPGGPWMTIPGSVRVKDRWLQVRVTLSLSSGSAEVELSQLLGKIVLMGTADGTFRMASSEDGVVWLDPSDARGAPHERGMNLSSADLAKLFRTSLAEVEATQYLREARETNLFARWYLIKKLWPQK